VERAPSPNRSADVEQNATAEHLPWATQPSDDGHAICGWCDRAIYRPAVPCSVKPVAGLLTMPTQPGQGERCKFELATRTGRDDHVESTGA
jgi:hypothetical protein